MRCIGLMCIRSFHIGSVMLRCFSGCGMTVGMLGVGRCVRLNFLGCSGCSGCISMLAVSMGIGCCICMRVVRT